MHFLPPMRRDSKSHLFLSHVNVWRNAFQMMNKQKGERLEKGKWKTTSGDGEGAVSRFFLPDGVSSEFIVAGISSRRQKWLPTLFICMKSLNLERLQTTSRRHNARANQMQILLKWLWTRAVEDFLVSHWRNPKEASLSPLILIEKKFLFKFGWQTKNRS